MREDGSEPARAGGGVELWSRSRDVEVVVWEDGATEVSRESATAVRSSLCRSITNVRSSPCLCPPPFGDEALLDLDWEPELDRSPDEEPSCESSRRPAASSSSSMMDRLPVEYRLDPCEVRGET